MRLRPPLARSLLVVGLWVSWAAPTLAHPDDGTARPLWRLRTFSSRDGLAHDVVRDVLEAHGVLWFATMRGLTRYDPASCGYAQLSDAALPRRQQVMALAEGRDGALWAATLGGGTGLSEEATGIAPASRDAPG